MPLQNGLAIRFFYGGIVGRKLDAQHLVQATHPTETRRRAGSARVDGARGAGEGGGEPDGNTRRRAQCEEDAPASLRKRPRALHEIGARPGNAPTPALAEGPRSPARARARRRSCLAVPLAPRAPLLRVLSARARALHVARRSGRCLRPPGSTRALPTSLCCAATPRARSSRRGPQTLRVGPLPGGRRGAFKAVCCVRARRRCWVAPRRCRVAPRRRCRAAFDGDGVAFARLGVARGRIGLARRCRPCAARDPTRPPRPTALGLGLVLRHHPRRLCRTLSRRNVLVRWVRGDVGARKEAAVETRRFRCSRGELGTGRRPRGKRPGEGGRGRWSNARSSGKGEDCEEGRRRTRAAFQSWMAL